MKRFLLFGFAFFLATKTMAASINLDELKNQGIAQAQSIFDAFAYDLGAAMSYKSIIPAEPLGLLGFDVGAEVTFTQMSRKDQWLDVLIPNVPDKFPAYIPVGKLHAHKGLPFGIDLGLSYGMTIQKIQVVGAEVRYSFVSGNTLLPAIAVRGTYSQLVSSTNLSDLESSGPISLNTKGIEATISKGILMLTPYAGIGHIWSQVTPNFDDPILNELKSVSHSYMKYFLGVNFNLALLNLAAEVDKTGEAMSYSLKAGLRF